MLVELDKIQEELGNPSVLLECINEILDAENNGLFPQLSSTAAII